MNTLFPTASAEEKKYLSRGALLSEDMVHRFQLFRTWDKDLPSILFIMLNPSIANGEKDDHTIRRCVRFAKDWGYGSLYVGNLFSFRATNPSVLITTATSLDKVVHPDNDKELFRMFSHCQQVVFAWGNYGKLLNREKTIAERFPMGLCLGKTAFGCPKHPLRLNAKTPLEKF